MKPIDPRFTKLPRALAEKTRTATLGPDIPALLAHPNWATPAPAVIWMHGRTAHKELDPGRYLRWIRAGFAAVAIDLPGHGHRKVPGGDSPDATLKNLAQMVNEIDAIVKALETYDGLFDPTRLAIGGMSAGGMAALRRLCDPHPFVAAAVECTTGNLADLYFPSDQSDARPWPVNHNPEDVATLDPMQHLDSWKPIPLLALHNQSDRIIPIQGQLAFLDRITAINQAAAEPGLLELHTWDNTGAPAEHGGFGRFSNDAKNIQTAFFTNAFANADDPQT